MKKLILFITAILIGFSGVAQMGDFPVSPNYGGKQAAAFQSRVLDSAGTYENNVYPHDIDVLKSYGIEPVWGVWAAGYTAGSVMTQLPTDGSGDLTSTRAGTASRVNPDMSVEFVSANTPRVDYTNGIPYFNFEKATENLIERQEFGHSYWTKSGATIEGDPSSAGSDLLSGWDFTVDWAASGPATIDDADSFTTTGAGGIRLNSLLTTGKHYIMTVAGTTTSSVFEVRSYAGTTTYSSSLSGTFSETFQFYTNDVGLYLRVTDAGTTDITTLTVQEVTGFTSPSTDYSTSAYKLVEDGSTGAHSLQSTITGLTNGNTYTMSIFAKAGERNWIRFIPNTGASSKGAYFDVENGVVGTVDSGVEANITALTNGWYKCSITVVTDGTTFLNRFYITNGDNSPTYTGDGTSGVYIFGAQLTEEDYASSFTYSGTEGSTSLRAADAITGGGDAATFSSVNESGCLVARIAAHSDDLTSRQITLSDGTADNRVMLFYSSSSNTIYGYILTDAVNYASLDYVVSDITDFHTIVVRWNTNDFSLWIDGIERDTDSAGDTPALGTFNTFDFSRYDGSVNYFRGKTEYVYVTSYLSDTQIANLP